MERQSLIVSKRRSTDQLRTHETLTTCVLQNRAATSLRRWFVEQWPWFRFYNFIEAIYTKLNRRDEAREALAEEAFANHDFTYRERQAPAFERDVNRYFQHAGVGWQLVDGEIQTRGSEGFEAEVGRAREVLEASGLQTVKKEIHEALQDLSRRPKPDLSGAIQHGMGALECVARDVTGDSKATLGEVLKRHPNLLPKPLDKARSQVWGYASEKARHLREGSEPGREESEFIVGLAATTVVYLTQKFK